MQPSQKTNAMSIDVEDYFQVAAFKNCIDPKTWDAIPCRIEKSMETVFDQLDQANVKATFFTLGWVAKRYPSVIRKIVAGGHELASHGYGHAMITDLKPESFRQDVISAKNTLEDIGGVAVIGYRAPSFSIGPSTLWAHDILKETGHAYSSSVYPIKHDLYGMPEAPRFHHLRPNGLLEIPATSVRFNGTNFPASGGGFFRLFPLPLSKRIIERVNNVDQEAAVFYCHPWEFDPEQPRIASAPLKSKFRHYLNLKSNTEKFGHLLRAFKWAPMRQVFGRVITPATDAA
jgi:polysaccharide deacetylase family protein (PEP-CTERM system associated)